MNRLVIVPDPMMETAGLALRPRLVALASELDANNILHAMGPLAVRLLEKISAEWPDFDLLLFAPEGTDHALAWISSSDADALIGKVRASSDEGLVARASESQRSYSVLAPDVHADEWTNLERLRGQTIVAFTASPVVVFETTVAVLCRVRHHGSGEFDRVPPAETAPALARLIEDRLIRLSLGLEST